MTPRKEKALNLDADIVNEQPDQSTISKQEIDLLDQAGEDEEEQQLHKAELDTTDEDGELLNEQSFADSKSGRDLDVPGTEEDDDNEDIGEEDEENNSYSLGGEKED